MKKFFIILIFIIFIPVTVYAYEVPELDGEDGFNETVTQTVNGELNLNPVKILNAAAEMLIKEIKSSAAEIVILLSAAAMSGVVNVLTGSFGNKSSGEAAFFACFTLMSAAALRCFNAALLCGTAAIEAMSIFTDKLSPLLMIVLIACGKVTSANTFQPVLSASVYIISLILKNCLVPLITFGAVLSVAGNINDKMQISNFTRVVRSLSKWLMAAIITVFTGISAKICRWKYGSRCRNLFVGHTRNRYKRNKAYEKRRRRFGYNNAVRYVRRADNENSNNAVYA